LSLILMACGSSTGHGAPTTTVENSPVASEGPSTTVGVTTSTTSMPATTTTEATTTTAEADAIEIVVEDGVVNGPERLEARLGSKVMFVVVSDAIDHVHVHGYDVSFEVAPGSPAEVQFTADVPGIFEIELEDSHMLLLELEVS
jgi:hypothetical protein